MSSIILGIIIILVIINILTYIKKKASKWPINYNRYFDIISSISKSFSILKIVSKIDGIFLLNNDFLKNLNYIDNHL